jgi:hypothetical protein
MLSIPPSVAVLRDVLTISPSTAFSMEPRA